MDCTGCGKQPKRWVRDGEVGWNCERFNDVNIIFDYGTFMSGRDLLLAFFSCDLVSVTTRSLYLLSQVLVCVPVSIRAT